MTIFNGVGLSVVYYGVGKHIQHVPLQDLSMWFLVCYPFLDRSTRAAANTGFSYTTSVYAYTCSFP